MNHINIVLLTVAVGSGFAVVTQQNLARQRHAELSAAEKQQRELEQEYSRLQLKQAELSNHQLIRKAAEKGKLVQPSAADTKVIEIE